jgi:uncharacterized membrane protein
VKRVERSGQVPAPPERVFDYLADLGNIGEWQTGVASVQVLTPGPMQAGSRAQIVRDVMGQRIQAPLTITAFDRPSRLGIETKVSGVQARGLLELRPSTGSEAATDVRFSMEIRGSMLSSFLEPMIANAAVADIDASLERIRAKFAAS